MVPLLHILDIVAKVLFVVVFFGLCIFVHELGHLLVALWRGLYVEKFSVGFGKRLWGKRINGVDYIVSALPFGGYVALPQLDPSDEPTTSDGTPLPGGPPVSRALTAVAGPLANVVFGFFLALFIWWFGTWVPAPQEDCTVLTVPPILSLFTDGLEKTDKVIAVDGKKVEGSWWEITQQLPPLPPDRETMVLRVKRKGSEEPVEIEYTPKSNPEYDAGLRGGDVIVAVQGQPISKGFADVKERTMLATEPVRLTVRRGGEALDFSYTPAENPFLEGLGHPFYDVKQPVAVESVIPGSPAEAVGLRKDDILVSVNGKAVENSEFFIDQVNDSKGKALLLVVKRDGELVELPEVHAEEKEIDGETAYLIGARLTVPKVLDYPNPWEQFVDVFTRTKQTLASLFAPVMHKESHVRPRHMSGPIGILNLIFYKALVDGYRGGLSLIILVSFSLAFFNLLPFPVLDGGHIVYSLFEIGFRRKVPTRLVYWLQTVFAVLLISFMLYVTFYDVRRTPRFFRIFFPGKSEKVEEKADDEKQDAEEKPAAPAEQSAPAPEAERAPEPAASAPDGVDDPPKKVVLAPGTEAI